MPAGPYAIPLVLPENGEETVGEPHQLAVPGPGTATPDPTQQPTERGHHVTTVPDMVCLHCQDPLSRFDAPDQPQPVWLHPSGADRDHEPFPIPRAEATNVRSHCDFCYRDSTAWVYHTKAPITMIGLAFAITADGEVEVGQVQHVYDTGWAACNECSKRIERGDVEGLIDYIKRVGPDQARAMPRDAFRMLWQEVFRSISHRTPINPDTD